MPAPFPLGEGSRSFNDVCPPARRAEARDREGEILRLESVQGHRRQLDVVQTIIVAVLHRIAGETNQVVMTDHVGIILEIQGDLWSLVAGGAGGRRSKHDGVKRTPLEAKPAGLLGWLDVDAYFACWSGPDVGDV